MNTIYRVQFALCLLAATACLAACGADNTSSSAAATSSSAKSSVAATTALAITGQPPSSISVGSIYYYNANTTGGTTSAVKFSIQNKPYWATLNTTTGELRGTPDKSGVFSDIVISATDGTSSAAMKAFSITVYDSGSSAKVTATVSWAAPTSNTDGSTFNDPSGFVIHYGTSATALSQSVTVGSNTARSYNLTGLSKGLTYYFSVAAINAMNMEGERSAVTSITL